MLVIVGVAALVAALLLAVIPIIVDQVAELIEQIPGIIAQLNRVDLIEWLQQQFPLLKIDEISQQAGAALTDFFTNPDKLSEPLGGVWAVALAIGGGVFGVIIVAILTSTSPRRSTR